MAEEKKETVDPHFKKFWDSVPIDADLVTMILKCHLLAEYNLDQILILQVPRGDMIVDGRFQFSEKLTIVEALDVLDKETVDSLRKLNAVRNSCSHELNYEVTDRDLDKIGSVFPEQYLVDKKKSGDDKKALLHRVLMEVMVGLALCIDRLSARKLAVIESRSKKAI